MSALSSKVDDSQKPFGVRALRPRERKELVRLLGLLQNHLKSSIESAVIPGTNDGLSEDQAGIEEDRKNLRAADDWVTRLTIQSANAVTAQPAKTAEKSTNR